MALINVIKFEGSQDELAWKWEPSAGSKRGDQIRLGSQLIVNPAQEAIFIKGGQVFDIFSPGTYTLHTKNIPLLASFNNLPFGGDSPFEAEVYFVNKAVALGTKWGLTPFNVMDPTLKVPLPISARGDFAVKVTDSKQFLTQIIGTMDYLYSEEIKKFFRGLIVENVKSGIGKIAKEQGIGPMEMEAIVGDVAGAVRSIIGSTMSNYGITLDLFNIEAIPLIDTDPEVKKLLENYRKIMSEDLEERMRLRRHSENLETYRTERSLDATQAVAENIGGSGNNSGGFGNGLMGTVIGLGMATPVANAMGAMVQQNMAGTKQQGAPCPNCRTLIPENGKFCLNCGFAVQAQYQQPQDQLTQCNKCSASFPVTSKFCPNCGDIYNPCPNCKADNEEGAINCKSCGAMLPIACEQCGTLNNADAKFCSNCGKSTQMMCVKCNNPYTKGTKFCTNCGNNLQDINN